MTSALPEIAESDASGQVADIYEDIRQSLKLRNVNLIYRYFATIDGALPWAWSVLKPHFLSGQLKRHAQQSRVLYDINFHLKEQLPKPSLTEIERRKITEILDFYLQANPMNLFALQILNKRLAAQSSSHAGQPVSRITPLVTGQALQHAAGSHQFSSLARELMFYVSQGVDQVRPTLLRQLAGWPHFIELIAGFMKTICCDPNFVRQTDSVVDYSLANLGDLERDPGSTKLKSGPARDLSEFCAYFPAPLIRMTIIASHLRKNL